MSELLTPAEIIDLTGAKRGYKQCETLAASGIKFVPRCDGKPAVTWTAVNTALSAQGASIAANNGFNLKAIQ
jgi:hypothetical protein